MCKAKPLRLLVQNLNLNQKCVTFGYFGAKPPEAKSLDEQLPRIIEDLKKIVCGKEAEKYQAQLDDKGQIIFVLKQEAEDVKSK